MKKLKYIILSILLIISITNIDILIDSTKYASILFFNKIFVCIFPFIILIDILIFYDYHVFLERIFGKLIEKIFNIPKNTTIMIIMSLFLASPSNTLILKNMLDNNEIDETTTNRILTFTFTNSIPFVIGSIGITLYNSFKIGLVLYIFMVINNILIGIYLSKKGKITNNNTFLIKKDKNILNVIKNSIIKAFNTSLIILGNIIISICIINLIKKYIPLNPLLLSLISGIIEITNGIIITSNLDIPLTIKLSITLFLLSFNGLSIIFQSFSLLSNYKINIKRILITKLVFSFIIALIFYVLIIFVPITSIFMSINCYI